MNKKEKWQKVCECIAVVMEFLKDIAIAIANLFKGLNTLDKTAAFVKA